MNLDEILAYHTVKFASIQDRRLGGIYYLLCLLVAAWVIGFQIFYGNEHFQLYDVKGTATLTMQEPTKDYCDPRKPECVNILKKAEELPYCKEFQGEKPEHVEQGECVYADLITLTPSHHVPASLFVPTRLDRIEQVRGCNMTSDSAGYCNRLWDTVEEHRNTFVADIEDYTVKILSAFSRRGMSGTSLDHKGFYYECVDLAGQVLATEACKGNLTIKPIPCLNDGCGFDANEEEPEALDGFLQLRSETAFVGREDTSGSFKHQAARQLSLSPEKEAMAVNTVTKETVRKDAYAIPNGDVFSLSKLLQLAGLDLDEKFGKGTLRQRGTEISIEVEWRNLRPWTGNSQVSYVYRVKKSPVKELKMNVYAPAQPSDIHRRTVENQHGVHIRAEVAGSFGFFNIVYLLVMLTTSVALLSGAKTVVDALALYCPSRRQQFYEQAKYEIVSKHGEDTSSSPRV